MKLLNRIDADPIEQSFVLGIIDIGFGSGIPPEACASTLAYCLGRRDGVRGES